MGGEAPVPSNAFSSHATLRNAPAGSLVLLTTCRSLVMCVSRVSLPWSVMPWSVMMHSRGHERQTLMTPCTSFARPGNASVAACPQAVYARPQMSP